MTTVKTGALVAALLTAAAPAALAAHHHGNAGMPVPHVRTIVGWIQPSQIRASKMIGMDVFDKYNQKVGSVQDIVLNRNGTVAAVVFDVNGKNVALPMTAFNASRNRLTLTNISQPQLNQAATYHLTNQRTGAGTTGSPLHGGQLGSGR